MLVEALIVTFVYVLGRCEWFLGSSNIRRPIVLGTILGILLGQPAQGAIMGATLELAFIGAVSIGASLPPEMISGTVLGVGFAIVTGGGTETALALGIPIASLLLVVNTVLNQPILILMCHRCDHYAELGDTRGFERTVLASGFIPTIIMAPIIFCAFYFGTDAVTSALNVVPDFVRSGISVACGMIPAIGFAMLAQMVWGKKVAPFFFLGYFLVAYLEISTTGITIFAVIIAALIMLLGNHGNLQLTANAKEEVDDNEF